MILENVLLEVDEYVRHGNSINIMNSFSKEVQEIENMLLYPTKIVCETARQLITFLGKTNKFFKGSILVVIPHNTNVNIFFNQVNA